MLVSLLDKVIKFVLKLLFEDRKPVTGIAPLPWL
tara:strand:- start:970 stop:1071 length:102 start_codon:yes stop_codon:yes gene_type:complete